MERFTLKQVEDRLIIRAKPDIYAWQHSQKKVVETTEAFLKEKHIVYLMDVVYDEGHIALDDDDKLPPFCLVVNLHPNDAIRWRLNFSLAEELEHQIEVNDRAK